MSLNSTSSLSSNDEFSFTPPVTPRSYDARRRSSSLNIHDSSSHNSEESESKSPPRSFKRNRNATVTNESLQYVKPNVDTKPYKFKISSAIPVHSSTEKEFTAFLINVTHPNGEVKTILRRYRQFAALHNSIQKSFPNVETPHFPKKRVIGNLSQHVIEKRRQKLETYLNFIVTIPGMNNFLAFETFLGADLRQRGIKNKGKQVELDPEIEELYKETEKERELRIAQERRFNEVKQFIIKLDEWIQKLICLENSFNKVFNTSDFIKLSDFSKLVVSLGKHLGKRKLPPHFVPKELQEDQKSLITNPKVLSIRQKITPAIDEIQQKLYDIKSSLLDLSYPMNQVLELENIVDDIQDLYDESCIIPRSLGFRIESGTPLEDNKSEQFPTYIKDNMYWYKTYFYKKDHIVCYSSSQVGDFVIAIVPLKFSEKECEFRLFICTKDGNEYTEQTLYIPNLESEWKERYKDIIMKADLRLRGVDWIVCDGSDVESLILNHESKDMRITRKLKFGILLCLKNQIKEEDMFNNEEEIPSFKEFLDFMGDRIELGGYTGFAGGLDTKGTNTTGKYSLISRRKVENDSSEFEIMYHVSTMLPHGEQDQQLAKKRHIGNDIVLLVFQEEGSLPYSPLTVKSNYIQIIIVVRAINIGEGKYAWHVNVCSAQDVPNFGPPLPYPPIFDNKDELRTWLTDKMINAELASYKSKLFVQQLRSTYKTLLKDLMSNMPVPKKKKSKSLHKKK